jgi:anaerobic magnesium-protoporphyrin IX monomethyl ester cyclase
VLIVTGTLLAVDETSVRAALHKQVQAMRASTGPWLDLRLKLLAAEELLAQQVARRAGARRGAWWSPVVEDLLSVDFALGAPELTEVVLMTLLESEGVAYEAATFSALSGDDALRQRLLEACPVVFLSSTLLRDQSELLPLVRLLKRPDNRVVVGGALAPLLKPGWPGSTDIDVLAVGDGERLVGPLVRWARGEALAAPEGGSLSQAGPSVVLSSGPMPGRSLDALPRPDWALAERYHGQKFPMVFYESVRGCPYRCSFCNYPYLFDDSRFRTRSAQRIAEDWTAYARAGVQIITCLDSLFTVPPRRLDELCALLIERDLGLQWICYARADDLQDPARVARMRRAGCVQVQIGLESGDEGQLQRMAKQCTAEQGLRALAVCREQGIVTLCTFIVGFPGETRQTLMATRDLILRGQPDFYYLAPFTTRVLGVPILSEGSRERYGLETSQGITSSAPYWRHATLSAAEVPELLVEHNAAIVEAGASLDATLLYRATVRYRPEHRSALLALQKEAAAAAPWTRRGLRLAGRWVQQKLEQDLERVLG